MDGFFYDANSSISSITPEERNAKYWLRKKGKLSHALDKMEPKRGEIHSLITDD